MVLFNYSTKELTAKVVYYGPGLCGKTTNLQYVHENLPGDVKGKMLSLATKTDRTLFFDFLPLDLGTIRGMKTRIQLYTVPGQVFYNETRKLVLKGADGIVFVADSQEQMVSANVESFRNLEENLRGHGMNLAEMPHVIQFNKRDLPKVASVDEMNSAINKYNAPFYESVATTGIGVQDTLKAITKLVLLHLTSKYDPKSAGRSRSRPSSAPAAAAPAPAPQGTPIAATPIAPTPAVAPPQARPAAAAPKAPEFADVPSIPLATADPIPTPAPAAASVAAAPPASAAPAAPAAPKFGNDDIEDLMGDIGPAPVVPPTVPSPSVAAAPPASPATSVGAGLQQVASGASDEPVELIDVADDQSLFDDPALDIAQIRPGSPKEIVVPVELGQGTDRKRFKLSVVLRLDPVDS